MGQFICSECKANVSRCRVPGTVIWAWRCATHGVLHEVVPRGEPRAVELPDGYVTPNRQMRRDAARKTNEVPAPRDNDQHGGGQEPHATHRSSKGKP